MKFSKDTHIYLLKGKKLLNLDNFTLVLLKRITTFVEEISFKNQSHNETATLFLSFPKTFLEFHQFRISLFPSNLI